MCYLFTKSLSEMGKNGILTSNTLRIFCSVAASTKTQSAQADLEHKTDFKIMCISGGISILMSVPPGSEKREVTVDVLYPQIFAGINTLKPQGQIKYKSKFRQ